jgi:hypothetical protein
VPAPDAGNTRPLPAGSAVWERTRRGGVAARNAVTVLTERPLTTLAALAVGQWILIAAYAVTVRHNGWLFYQGGDQIQLLTTGWLLGTGDLAPSYVGYGWPLVTAPITYVTGASFIPAMPPVIFINVVLLGPLGLWALYGLASRIAGRAFGLLAAAGWVVLPFAVIPLWRFDYHERYVEQFLPGALGLTALADYQSMVLLLVGALLFMRALETRAPIDALGAGLVVAFAIAVKPSNSLFLGAPVAAALLARNLRPLLPFALAFLPTVVTLAIWKQRGLGTIPAFTLEETRVAASAAFSVPVVDKYVNIDWANLHDNLSGLREYFWSARLLEWAPIAGVVGVARRSPPLAGLLGVWFGTFLLVKGSTILSTVASGSFFRFLMPAFPAYFLLAASTLLLVPGVAQSLATRWPDRPASRLDRRLVAALAVAFALVPLVIVPFLRPLPAPTKALVVNNILTPVDSKIEVSVVPDGESRTLAWTHPSTGSTRVFYRVYRTAAGGRDFTCLEHGGAAECNLKMLLLGTTRDARWRDGSPPAGALYRIGVAANSQDDPAGGDVATISRPIPESP